MSEKPNRPTKEEPFSQPKRMRLPLDRVLLVGIFAFLFIEEAYSRVGARFWLIAVVMGLVAALAVVRSVR